MPKGLEAFVEMNRMDMANKTTHLQMGLDVVNVRRNRAGTVISIGIGGDHVAAIANGNKRAILLVVDQAELDKIQSEQYPPVWHSAGLDSRQGAN